MELSTARLRINALRVADADALFEYRSDPRVARFQGWCPATRGEVLAFMDTQQRIAHDSRGGWHQYAIRLATDGSLIGDLGLNVPEDGDASCEFGISVAPVHQRHGYAREALEALFDDAFRERKIHRLHASIDPRNTASVALMRSLGMRQEAHFRECYKLRGEWVDDVIFALLAREWR